MTWKFSFRWAGLGWTHIGRYRIVSPTGTLIRNSRYLYVRAWRLWVRFGERRHRLGT